jgi:Tat protein translocase TatB subunit
MFEVGFTEIILILGIALLVLGPEKLPKLASQVGRWAGRARAMARQLRAQLDEEVTVMPKDDFGPRVQKPPGTPPGTPPESPPQAPGAGDGGKPPAE